MTVPLDRARLRALAGKARDAVAALDGMGDCPIAEQIALMRARNGALGALEAACTPHDILALLDALDAAERERDEARERQRVAEVAHGAVLQATVEIVAERDALAALLRSMTREFRRVFPIYYYAEPWAHDRNEVLRAAEAALAAREG